MSKNTPAPAKGGGSTLGKLALISALAIGGYGLATGQFTMPASGKDSPTVLADKPAAVAKGGPSSAAGIPANYLALYKQHGGMCAHLDWALLAGIGFTESIHGTYKGGGVQSGSNKDGEQGPMQFTPKAWATVRGNHPDVGSNPYDPAAAIPAAAHKLCDDGVAGGNVDQALLRYNGGSAYVGKVKAKAATYRKAG